MNAVVKERQETMPTKIEAYTPTALALADLNARYADIVFDVSTPTGMKQAKEARMEIRGYRADLEKPRVAIKSDALAQCKLIDTEANRIKQALESLEDPIDQQIKAEEARKEEARIAAEKAEMERVARIQQSIIAIRNQPAALTGKPSAEIRDVLYGIQAMEITTQRYAEFLDHANAAKNEVILVLAKMADDTERLEAERAELARLREEEVARQAEAQRLADEQRAREQAELQAERQRLAQERAEHEAQMKAEREAREAEARERAREQDRAEAERRRIIEAERQRIAAEQAEIERRQEAVRREEERAKAEAQRREQEERAEAERATYAEKERLEQEAAEQAEIKEMEDEVAVLAAEINIGNITVHEALRCAYTAGVNAERRNRHA